jgi:hypothetical protein
MWRTQDGTVHTVALPDPTEPFTHDALKGIRRFLAEIDPAAAHELIDALVDEAIEEAALAPFVAAEEEPFVDSTPLVGLFATVVRDESELRAALVTVDWRWRLDILNAIDDLIAA